LIFKPIAMENKKKKLTTAPGIPYLENQNSTSVDDWYNRNAEEENEYYTQRGNSYKLLSKDQKQNLIRNIVHSLSRIEGSEKELMVNKQLCHWFRIDISLGIAVAKGLDLDLSETMKHMPQTV
jgi:catalase